ncbi:MAG: IS66 family insertion sequence element accessory protein TnpB [Pseudomonadota bacterium]
MTKRKQRSRAQWLELIEQQKQSGLKASEFCRQQELNPQYFSKRKRHLSLHSESALQPSPFVKVKPLNIISAPSNQSRISLSYQNILLQLPTNIEPHWLAQLVRALT